MHRRWSSHSAARSSARALLMARPSRVALTPSVVRLMGLAPGPCSGSRRTPGSECSGPARSPCNCRRGGRSGTSRCADQRCRRVSRRGTSRGARAGRRGADVLPGRLVAGPPRRGAPQALRRTAAVRCRRCDRARIAARWHPGIGGDRSEPARRRVGGVAGSRCGVPVQRPGVAVSRDPPAQGRALAPLDPGAVGGRGAGVRARIRPAGRSVTDGGSPRCRRSRPERFSRCSPTR